MCPLFRGSTVYRLVYRKVSFIIQSVLYQRFHCILYYELLINSPKGKDIWLESRRIGKKEVTTIEGEGPHVLRGERDEVLAGDVTRATHLRSELDDDSVEDVDC